MLRARRARARARSWRTFRLGTARAEYRAMPEKAV